jgi:hypothetical protein
MYALDFQSKISTLVYTILLPNISFFAVYVTELWIKRVSKSVEDKSEIIHVIHRISSKWSVLWRSRIF